MALKKEDLRQATHFGIGLAAVLAVQFIGFNSALLLMAAIFLAGLCLANFKLLGGKVKTVDFLLGLMDREVPVPGQGAMFYAAGILLLLAFSRPFEFGLGIILLHAAGDASATFIGIRSKTKLPWNTKKTWKGLAAFILTGVVAAQFFIPLQQAIVYAVLLAFIESLALPVDDNVSVPVASLMFKGVGI